MPLYDYQCAACHGSTESRQPVSVSVIPCPACGGVADRQISLPAPPVLDTVTPYYDHGLGTVVRSRSQRRTLMRAHGLVEKGTTHLSGTRGTLYSLPGQAARSAPKSGGHAGPLVPRG